MDNYELSATSFEKSATITAKEITVTADNKSRAYGEANPTFTATVGTTGVSGETGKVTGALATSATVTSNVGTYDITKGTLALTDNGDFKASNYTMKFAKGTLTITKKQLTVTSFTVNKTTKTYDGTTAVPSGFKVTATGLANSDAITVSYTSAVYNNANVANANKIIVSGLTIAGDKKDNYELSGTSLTSFEKSATITAKEITVTAADKTRKYKVANPTFTATVGNTGITGETGKITGAPTTSATTDSDAGTYEITKGTLALTDNGTFKTSNYTMKFVKGTLTITKADGYVTLSENERNGIWSKDINNIYSKNKPWRNIKC